MASCPVARANQYNAAMPQEANIPAGRRRYQIVDLMRGVAIALMIAYHFSFDLNYYGFIEQDFYEGRFWIGFRVIIVSLFLGLVGVSLVLAHARGFRPRPYFRRLGILVACAALVSLGSWLMFPKSMIFFGILHFIAVASVLGLLFLRLHWLNLLLGAALVAIGISFAHPRFDQPGWQWLGLVTRKPVTEDYVPLLPWFGVVLIGIFLGRVLFLRPGVSWLADWRSAHPLARLGSLAGRHSLLIYMVHQPILLGLLYLPYWLVRT